jgi:hypothetical protein
MLRHRDSPKVALGLYRSVVGSSSGSDFLRGDFVRPNRFLSSRSSFSLTARSMTLARSADISFWRRSSFLRSSAPAVNCTL